MFRIDETSRCAVVGYGSWATALVKILTNTLPCVGWHIGRREVIDHITTHGNNPRYLSDVHFDTERLRMSDHIDTVVGEADIVVLAVPSAFLKNALEPLTVPLRDKYVVSAIKGIIPDDYVTVAEHIRDRYGVPFDNIGIVSGPCHAEEVALERLSYLTMVSKHMENSQALSAKFATEYIRTVCSTDIYGVEYAAVLKNIYAICAGIAVGLGYGDNFLAVLVANAAIEMNRFLQQTYPSPRETNASVYLGDLMVTCYSQFSRNRTFGSLIGRGYDVRAALSGTSMIAEGYYASDCIDKINKSHGIEMPIADCVHNILYNGAIPSVEIERMTAKLF